MLIVEKQYISEDIMDFFFVCNLEKCKGACCAEGDLGAPLEKSELSIMEGIYDEVKPYLSPEGVKAIEEQGLYIFDEEGDWSTPTIEGRACAYSRIDAQGKLECGIEKAYLDGKIDFQKPISCHLYPIRITHYDSFDAINYHKWDICNPACSLGAELGIELYKFLKNPLIRKYGEEWYQKLLQAIDEMHKQRSEKYSKEQ